jgi:hypothetical protein
MPELHAADAARDAQLVLGAAEVRGEQWARARPQRVEVL